MISPPARSDSFRLLSTIPLALLVSPVLLAADNHEPKNVYAVNVAREQSTGAKIRGPATIRLRGVNILRNQVSVGDTTTFTAQDLSVPFLPKLPAAAKPAAGAPPPPPAPPPPAPPIAVPAAPTLESEVIRLAKRLGMARDSWTQLQTEMANAAAASNRSKGEVESLLAASDGVLQAGGGSPSSIQSGIIDLIDPITTNIDAVLATNWPDNTALLLDISEIRTELQGLPLAFSSQWAAWYGNASNKAVYDSTLAATAEIASAASAAGATSPGATAFETAKRKLFEWKSVLLSVKSVGAAGFTVDHPVGCAFSFGSTKEVRVDLITADRLAVAGTAPVRREIVTVVCTTPLSVSGGLGFSTVDEGTFGLQPATKTTTTTGGMTQTVTTNINKFGYLTRSGFRPLPLLLANVRLWEPNEMFSLHFSNGAAVDINTGNVGTDVEYITGLSVGLHRSVYLSAGFHVGRRAALVNFNVGDEAPAGVTSPPIEKQWKPGFIFTITYRIR